MTCRGPDVPHRGTRVRFPRKLHVNSAQGVVNGNVVDTVAAAITVGQRPAGGMRVNRERLENL